MSCSNFASLWLFVLIAFLSLTTDRVAVDAISASPGFSTYTQPDGTETLPLMIRGDESLQTWFQTEEDFSVVLDPATGYYVYGIVNRETGQLDPTPHRADGEIDPRKLGLIPDETPELRRTHGEEDESEERRLHSVDNRLLCYFNRTAENPCLLPTLTLLVRFNDHTDRKLPSKEDYETLFNSKGVKGTSILPSGSVRDFFIENSYGKHDMATTVSDWIDVSYTEEAAAGYGKNGIGAHSRPAWIEALNALDSQNVINFATFDSDKNGVMDGLNIIHSGVEAAVGMTDCETGKPHTDRIWSHAAKASFWTAANGITNGPYYVASGVSGICSPGGAFNSWTIARIGVLTHEAFHDLGLLDMYDVHIGVGTGFFDAMSSSWGWSGNQKYPPHLSAWSKAALGWSNVIEVTRSAGGPAKVTQDFTLGASCEDPTILKISHNMPDGEYLLMEHRYGCGFDEEKNDITEPNHSLHRFGIALWHIDETDPKMFNRTSHGVCSEGSCPQHYRTALVQADGEWHLERGYLIGNHGDGGDLFKRGANYPGVAYKIDDFGITLNNGTKLLEPNTQSYSNIAEMLTGISIEVLSTGRTSSVRVTLTDNPTLPSGWTYFPTPAPTDEPVPTTPVPTPAPTPQPTDAGAKMITIQFKTDGYGEDTGMMLTDLDTDEMKLDMPVKSYKGKNNQIVNQVAWVTEGHQMELVFLDDYGDGIPNGYYCVYWGDPSSGVELARNDNFKKVDGVQIFSAKETFRAVGPAGVTTTPPPTPKPTPLPTKAPTKSPTMQPDSFEVPDDMEVYRVEIRPDHYLEDVHWKMEAMDGDFEFGRDEKYYISTERGLANGYDGVIVEHVLVPKIFKQLRFHMFDSFGDGTVSEEYKVNGQTGYYSVFFGPDHDEDNLLVHNENFAEKEAIHDFQNAPPDEQQEVEVTDKPTAEPTKSPTMTPTSQPTDAPTITTVVAPVNGVTFEFEMIMAPMTAEIPSSVLAAFEAFVEQELDSYFGGFDDAEMIYMDVWTLEQALDGDGLTIHLSVEGTSDDRRRLRELRKDTQNFGFWSRKGLEESGVIDRLRAVGGGSFSGVMLFQGVDEDDDPTCDDHPTYIWYLDGTPKSCRTLEHVSETKKHEWCTAYPELKTYCEESCGQCGFDDGCYDDEEATFLVHKFDRDCEWLRRRLDYSVIQKHCETTQAKWFCQETCENCEPLEQDAPTASPITEDGQCKDLEDRTFMFYGKERNCHYVRLVSHSWIGQVACEKTNAKHFCEHTCGTCQPECQNVEGFELMHNDVNRNCGWLYGTQNRRNAYCGDPEVAENCPRSCRLCDVA